MLNILKETLGAFVHVGDELAIDEASIASRSQFGRQFIFFNSAKNCGKFHYHFYFLNECDHYNMIWFRMATCDGSDVCDAQYKDSIPKKR